MKTLSKALLPLAITLGLGGWACSPSSDSADSSSGESAGSGDGGISAATTVQVVDMAGLTAALESYRGRAILLNFWATWCAPCVEELPELLEVHEEFRERGGEVVLVSYDLMIPGQTADAMRDKVQDFIDARGYVMDQWLFNDDDYDAINASLELPGPVPVTLAFDGAGREVDRHVEKAGKARFIEMMEKALAATE